MKKNSIFGSILLLIIISFLCIIVTVSIALLAGAADTELFNFQNLNFSNMLPILIVGCILSCFIIGIAVLIVGKNVFFALKDYFSKSKTNEKE